MEWTTSRLGDSHYLKLATGLTLRIMPDGIGTRNGPPVPYKVVVFEATLVKRYEKLEDAQVAAIKGAKAFLSAALANL